MSPNDIANNGNALIDAAKHFAEQGEKGKDSYDMLMKLAKCKGLQFLDKDSWLVEKLSQDPESCRSRIELIASKWQGAVDSGCPVEIASSSIRGAFNKYAYANTLPDLGKTLEEELYERPSRVFDAIDVLGARGYEAKKWRPNGANDGYISSLAQRMKHENIDENKALDIRAKLENFIDAFDGATVTSPITVEMSGKSDFGEMGIDELGDFAQALKSTASREQKLTELSLGHAESLHGYVFSVLNWSYYR